MKSALSMALDAFILTLMEENALLVKGRKVSKNSLYMVQCVGPQTFLMSIYGWVFMITC